MEPRPLSPALAADLMNELAAKHEPFLMFCDYGMTENYVVRLDDVDPDVLLFDFRGNSNVRLPQAETPLRQWHVQPPSDQQYLPAIRYVIGQANAGNTYLTNLTFASRLLTNLSLRQMFHSFHAPYKLHFADRFTVFSPEPFVTIEGGRIATYPMKGTLSASTPNAEAVLMGNRKEAAEHATIVDLLRNDLSQVADHVTVDRYRYMERIATPRGDILQTSSQISGRLFPDLHDQLGTVLYRLLPAGSITGAPKPSTLRIIGNAETGPRGFYTGVFGLFDGHAFQSAVAIRFVQQNQQGEMFFHAGGGITAQSEPQAEYEELVLKTQPPISQK